MNYLSTKHSFNNSNALSLACTLLAACFLSSPLIAAEQDWIPPRTASGAPDFQGLWQSVTITPLERPLNLGDKSTYTEEEAAQIEAGISFANTVRARPLDPDRAPPPAGEFDELATDIAFIPEIIGKVAYVSGEYRTALIIDPPDGRLPLREDSMDIYDQWRAEGFGEFDGTEIRPVSERCVMAGAPLPQMVFLQGKDLQIVQTDDYVVILSEYGYETRIIRLRGQHPSNGFNKWMGDSIGHFEGDTLVIHTQNFRPEQSMAWGDLYPYLKSSEQLQVTERITMISDNDLKYSYVATDPKIYSASFTVEIPFERFPEGDRFYEFACHEGNYSMRYIMAGARRQDLDAQQK